MPPLPSVPSVIKIRHRVGLEDASIAYTTWHMTYTGTAPTDSDATTLAGDIYTHWTADCAAVLCGARIFDGIDVIDLTSPTAAEGSHSGTTTGTLIDEPVGPQVTTLTSMAIARRYRGGKPRSYWPFGSSDVLTGAGAWDATFCTNVTGALETYLGHLEGLTVGATVLANLVSVSYYQGFTAVVNPITGRTRDVPKVRTGTIPVDQILSLSTSTKVATQRRRSGRKR